MSKIKVGNIIISLLLGTIGVFIIFFVIGFIFSDYSFFKDSIIKRAGLVLSLVFSFGIYMESLK